ncbi:S8 family peptidase [Streptomyces sp. CSDS2]|uniref:S8 family peptidase n=1 Tax=Streptomyces sp. CSDS2 TaxID=3055051 RepID=UPI0025B133CA|nr:S8 family peptidase [Streptomyces sp. CSDS2]MDN3261209.1 S8 family peptidase [Streptomyces sp. CSDS2]
MHISSRRRSCVLAAALAALTVPMALSPHAAAQPSAAVGSQHPPRTERLIVGFAPGSPKARSDQAVRDALKSRKTGTALTFVRRLATGAVLLKVAQRTTGDHPKPLAAVAEQVKSEPDAAYAEPDSRVRPMAAVTPNDPFYRFQWDLWDEAAGMNVPPAWELATGKGVPVAVIDTGYVTHSDLQPGIIPGYDFITDPDRARDGNGRDPNYHDPGSWTEPGQCEPGSPGSETYWHGTHVAGTVAARTGNGVGVASTAHDAGVQPVRVLGACGGEKSDTIEAIVWAAGGTVPGVPANKTPAKVINLSLGEKAPCSDTYQQAIDSAVRRGTTVVVAAGNDNANADDYTPANCDRVITVAAGDRQGNRASYSNWGPRVDITAPGGSQGTVNEDRILSTYNFGTTDPADESYAYLQGTSMAAPHISALAALLLQLRPRLTPAQVERVIKATARPITSCGDNCGAGLADAGAAVRSLTAAADRDTVPAGRGLPARS